MADTEHPKIISLHNRGEYKPPEPADPSKVDGPSVEMLKYILSLAEQGKILGICVMAVNQDRRGPIVFTQFPPDMDAQQAAWMYAGMIEEMRSSLADIGVHGLEELARIYDEENEDD